MKNILIVDDDKLFIDALTKILRKTYNVISFEDPKDVIPYLQNNTVDLIITDYRMPQMTGEELILSISAFNPSLKILLVTNYQKEFLPSAVMEKNLPIVNYIQKPIHRKDIDDVFNPPKDLDEFCTMSSVGALNDIPCRPLQFKEDVDKVSIEDFYSLEDKWGEFFGNK